MLLIASPMLVLSAWFRFLKPAQPGAIIHQFFSRSVAQWQDTVLVNELTRLFREHIVQPSADGLTRSTRAEPWEGQERVDELVGHFSYMAMTPRQVTPGRVAP